MRPRWAFPYPWKEQMIGKGKQSAAARDVEGGAGTAKLEPELALMLWLLVLPSARVHS